MEQWKIIDTLETYHLRIQKVLKPKILFWESTIPTYGLSKILQVSCYRCNKAIKIVSKCVGSFSVRKNWALYELVMVKNKSDRLHNKGCHHKGQYNVAFFCTKGLSIQTNKHMQPLLPSAKGLSFTFMYLLLCKESKFSFYSFLFSPALQVAKTSSRGGRWSLSSVSCT